MANNYVQCTPAQALKATKEEADILIRLAEQSEDECNIHGFTFEYYKKHKSFYMYAGGCGDENNLPEPFLTALGKLIQKNKLPYLIFGNAFTCDKMHPGQFGGGSFRIHTDGYVEHPEIVWDNKVDKLKDGIKYAINELKEWGSIEAVEILEAVLRNK